MEETGRVSIARLKANFARKFPQQPLTKILLSESDILTTEEFLAKVGTWLAICDLERNKNEKDQVKKGGI